MNQYPRRRLKRAERRVFRSGVNSQYFNFYYTRQYRTNWCYAACIEMIMRYNGIAIFQEDVAVRTCKTNAFSDRTNCPASILQISERLNLCGTDRLGKSYCVDGIQYKGHPTAEWLIGEMRNHRPVMVAIKGNTIGHVVLITGIEWRILPSGKKQIFKMFIRDPWLDGDNAIHQGKRVITNPHAFMQRVYTFWDVYINY